MIGDDSGQRGGRGKSVSPPVEQRRAGKHGVAGATAVEEEVLQIVCEAPDVVDCLPGIGPKIQRGWHVKISQVTAPGEGLGTRKMDRRGLGPRQGQGGWSGSAQRDRNPEATLKRARRRARVQRQGK